MKKLALYCLLAVLLVGLTGCGKDVDLSETVDQVEADLSKTVEKVKAAAAEMDAAQFKKMASMYKEKLDAVEIEANVLMTKLAEGKDVQNIKAKLTELTSRLNKLNGHSDVYLDALKAKGGSL